MIAGAPGTEEITEDMPLLERAVLATRQTDRPYTEDMLKNLTRKLA